jgi:outer membrane protein assembly complex protein YaeT
MTRWLILGIVLAFTARGAAQNLPGDSDEGVSQTVTQVRIVGLQGMSEDEVLERLGGRLDFIQSRPPSRSRADDADFLVRRLLEKEGYKDVDISWRIPDDRKTIILTVNSGARITIGEVEVLGVEGEQAESIADYYTGTSFLGGETNKPYIESDVEKGTQNAITYLKAQGYWAATGELTRNEINPETGEANLTFSANPGPLHTIRSLRVEGTIPPKLPDLRKDVQRYLEKTATAANLREIREGSAKSMRDEGYQFAKAFLDAEHNQGRSDLVLTLEPGAQYRLRRTRLTGMEDTDLSRVRRYFDRFSGESYDETRISSFRNTLLSTGAFDSVDRERNILEEERAIDITLHLNEGKPKGISYYAGAGSLEGFILGASYYDRNFLNKLYNLNIATEYSGIGFLGEVSITDPFLFGYKIRATPRAYILRNSFDEYSKLESGLGLTLSRELTRRQTLELVAELSYAAVRGEDLAKEALGETDYFLSVIGLNYLYDGRDSSVSPSKGFFGRLGADLGNVAGNQPNSFIRFKGQAAYHLPLNDKSALAFNVETGFLTSTDDDELPVDLRYFLGGSDSVRSFPDRDLGPEFDGTARGGQAYWFANMEYVRKIAGPVYGVAFLDAGALERDISSFPSFDPKYAAGLGLRLDLPIGPVRLEYGHALNPEGGDPNGAFHFAIGASF